SASPMLSGPTAVTMICRVGFSKTTMSLNPVQTRRRAAVQPVQKSVVVHSRHMTRRRHVGGFPANTRNNVRAPHLDGGRGVEVCPDRSAAPEVFAQMRAVAHGAVV